MMITGEAVLMALGALDLDLELDGVSVSLKLDTRRMLITFIISLWTELWTPDSVIEGFLLTKELALLITLPWPRRGSGW